MPPARGELAQPAVLERQVRRMLADPRAHALVTNFGAQWLGLRKLERATPQQDLFPDFDENLRQAMRRETELFFESMLREDRSVLDLLGANYTFVNERLARHYGIPNVYGSDFRRVTFDDDSARGGLLGQGSILTVTSYATRTSPVLRGKWVLDNLLGTPPPPPPPNVPDLVEKSHDGQGAVDARADGAAPRQSGLRRLPQYDGSDGAAARELRRGRPLARRAARSNSPIDASGALPDGSTKFDGPAGLRQALLGRRRSVRHDADREAVDLRAGARARVLRCAGDSPALPADAARSDYRLSSLILGIVRSTPFQMRRWTLHRNP